MFIVYDILDVIFRELFCMPFYQGFVKGEELCLSDDSVRNTCSMTFGWLYFYEKLKSHDLKQNSSLQILAC